MSASGGGDMIGLEEWRRLLLAGDVVRPLEESRDAAVRVRDMSLLGRR